MATIIGSDEFMGKTTSFAFDENDIVDTFGGPLSNEGLQEIANILASNVEGHFGEDEVVEIIDSNFNDAFDDMVEDLIEEIKLGLFA